MEALYVLIPIAIGVMIVVVIAFIYTVRSGQYDDLEGPAYRILMDDDDPRIPHQNQSNRKSAKGPAEETEHNV
ncbi:cbb3-type cytochrome oxidase assembly protein CcoS [Thiothrix eikelboomii]|uniref:cbb3-type cytochrome oxidase assembly protein CcoS n=1 Tax=Thiothrix eikelboomii TaxID=92487 RepID=UPI003BAE707F